MRTRYKDGDMWVLVDVYIAACGFMAHWFSHGGKHSFEPFTPIFRMEDRPVMIYTIKKIYQFTETVEVVADNEHDAKDIADRTAGDRNYDDHLVDCVVIDTQEQADETL